MRHFIKGKIARIGTGHGQLFINFENDCLFGFSYKMEVPADGAVKFGVGDDIFAEVEYEEDECDGEIVAAKIIKVMQMPEE